MSIGGPTLQRTTELETAASRYLLWIAGAVLLALIVGYVGAYYAMATPIVGSGALYVPIRSNAPLE